MKKIFLILFLLLLPILASAISVEQLDQANEVLTQMAGKISQLRNYVQLAKDGKMGEVTLTIAQRQDFIDRKQFNFDKRRI